MCKICPSTVLKRNGSTTSNLIRHIKKKHGGPRPSRQQSLITDHTTRATELATTKYPTTSIRKKELDKEVALFIAQDLRPTSIVNGAGFKSFCLKMDPRYQLPSRQSLREKIIPKLEADEKAKLSGMEFTKFKST